MKKQSFLVVRPAGTEPFNFSKTCLNMERVERLRHGALDDMTDLDAAYELTKIAVNDLEAFGTSGGETLDNEEMAALLRSLAAVLKRLGVVLNLPFWDFKSFKGYWIIHEMSGSHDMRRRYINSAFEPILNRLHNHHPHLRQGPDQTSRITDVTRRRLREGLRDWWAGALGEEEFLDRLYDLNNLPSYDSRFATAAQDIWQHRVNNPMDWDDDWIWYDERFGLVDNDQALLRFLAEMLHPVVRTDLAVVGRLRVFFNETLAPDGYEIIEVDNISGAPVFAARTIGAGVPGALKNLIFAADGPKPEFILRDAINNDVEIVKNEQFCLVYSQPLGMSGLTWGELITWWRDRKSLPESMPDSEAGRFLYQRLGASLHRDSQRPHWRSPEQTVFRTYCELYPINSAGAGFPALLPQVYLHMDPKTRRERGGKESVLGRERMDFLLLLPQGVRIVLEVDGQHHYAEGDEASPRLYSKMVAEDRALRLKGYEVYRFGGYELGLDSAPAMLRKFFADLIDS